MDKHQHLEQLFRLAKQDQAVQSFEQTKERFIYSVNAPSVNKTKTTQVFTKKWIVMLATVSTIALSVFLLWNNEETNKTKQQTEKATVTEMVSQAKAENTAPNRLKIKQEQVDIQKPLPFLATIQEVTELPFTSENKGSEEESEKYRDRKMAAVKPMDDIPYQFPTLTEEEIVITRKKKRSMLKALAKHDKNAYVFIPSGSFDYKGETVSVQAFYMGVGEVTNFEYRTFLFDLLIQGRKDEFLKAKPDQSKWNTYPMYHLKYFQDNYFSDKKYNDYCVVNISREGAELYCKWLSEEVRKYVGDEKQAQYNDVRLPLRVEWVKAASNEGKQLPYPWNGPYIRNSDGFYQGNFVHGKADSTVVFDTTEVNSVTAPSKSFWPNALGLYNMSGNAAEMVYEGMNRTEPGTAGGGWRSWPEEAKIYGPDPYKGITDPKPTIGFRVVSTYLIVYKK